ncbi:unnamed protein product [Oikopleura dioica]|uniref:Mitochondrial S-adenosylmethionine carrier protein n=1 Tax=Oikopleura dioica TaxID=34765 RepID=E4XTT0_OIKDI|nr:unnamed protein product [Oikopleura dioica]
MVSVHYETTKMSSIIVDTVKTRLQSKNGFFKSGGFKGLYRGLGIVSAGSVPGSALFFSIYEGIRRQKVENTRLEAFKNNFLAPSIAEMGACMVRVPVEVVKQRCQATAISSSTENLKLIMAKEGVPGLYRGFTATLCREVPFSIIQFPIWEALKKFYQKKSGIDRDLGFFESGSCGAISGAIAASTTTPLDVAKTRIMLDQTNGSYNIARILSTVYKNEGAGALFAGVYPRTFWITLGGFIYLGTLEKVKNMLMKC